jgi:hypothetical protein
LKLPWATVSTHECRHTGTRIKFTKNMLLC